MIPSEVRDMLTTHWPRQFTAPASDEAAQRAMRAVVADFSRRLERIHAAGVEWSAILAEIAAMANTPDHRLLDRGRILARLQTLKPTKYGPDSPSEAEHSPPQPDHDWKRLPTHVARLARQKPTSGLVAASRKLVREYADHGNPEAIAICEEVGL